MAVEVTLDQVNQAIIDVLTTGETWALGDTNRHISLERLYEMRDILRKEAGSPPIEEGKSMSSGGMFSVVAFGKPTSEGT